MAGKGIVEQICKTNKLWDDCRTEMWWSVVKNCGIIVEQFKDRSDSHMKWQPDQ